MALRNRHTNAWEAISPKYPNAIYCDALIALDVVLGNFGLAFDAYFHFGKKCGFFTVAHLVAHDWMTNNYINSDWLRVSVETTTVLASTISQFCKYAR